MCGVLSHWCFWIMATDMTVMWQFSNFVILPNVLFSMKFSFLFLEIGSHCVCSPSCSGTHSATQVKSGTQRSICLCCQMLGLKACKTMLGMNLWIFVTFSYNHLSILSSLMPKSLYRQWLFLFSELVPVSFRYAHILLHTLYFPC